MSATAATDAGLVALDFAHHRADAGLVVALVRHCSAVLASCRSRTPGLTAPV
jgi:hypothetical protein